MTYANSADPDQTAPEGAVLRSSLIRVCTVCHSRKYFKKQLYKKQGVVGWCEGVMYLMSPGRSADIGLQLGKACYPCSR